MNDRDRHVPDDRDQHNPQVDAFCHESPVTIGGGMHDDQEERTGQLLGEVLDLVDKATDDLTPDYIEDRLQQILGSVSAVPDGLPGSGPFTECGEGTRPGPWGEDRPESSGSEGALTAGLPPTHQQAGPQGLEQNPGEMVEAAQAEAAQIIADARRQAAEILAAAHERADSDPSRAVDEGGTGGPSAETSTTSTKGFWLVGHGASTESMFVRGDEVTGSVVADVSDSADPKLFVHASCFSGQLRFWLQAYGSDAGLLRPDLREAAAPPGRSGAACHRGPAESDPLLQRQIDWLRKEALRTDYEDLLQLVRGRLNRSGGNGPSRAWRRRWLYLRMAGWPETGRGDGLLMPIASLGTRLPGQGVGRADLGTGRGARVAADVLVPYPVPTLAPDQRLNQAVEQMVAADEHALPVHDGEAVIGVVTMTDAVDVSRRHPNDPVSSILRKPTVISAATPINTVRDQILTDSIGLLVVLDDSGGIAGYITTRTALAGQVEPDDGPPASGRLVTDLYDPTILLTR